MSKIITATAIVLILLLTGQTVFADGELKVIQTVCNILDYGNEYQIYCCAQVHNSSRTIVGLESGTFVLFNEKGIIAEAEVDRLWPYFLNPEEDGYLFQNITIEAQYSEDGERLPTPVVTGLTYDLNAMSSPVTTGNVNLVATLSIDELLSGGYVMNAHVANSFEEPAWNPQVVFGLYTSGGSLLYVDGQSLDDLALGAGSEVDLRFSVNTQIVRQWENYGVRPEEARIFATFRNDVD